MDMKNIGKEGFTLLELLIAITIGGMVLAGIVVSYHSQVRAHVTQETVVDMQQNLRGAMYHISREIRMVGFDLTGNANAGIQTAQNNTITITMDIHDNLDNDGDSDIDEFDEEGNSDGDTADTNENITYDLSGGNLRRNNQPAALNIDALNFVYLDEDGNVLDDDGAGNVTTSINDIRSIQITIVARAGSEAPVLARSYTNSKTYRNQQGTTILDLSSAPDDFRRRLLTTGVRCRNLGI